MNKVFDIHLTVGNSKIVLKGAREVSIIESSVPQQITAKAPPGGKTTFTKQLVDENDPSRSIGVTIHEFEDAAFNLAPAPSDSGE